MHRAAGGPFQARAMTALTIISLVLILASIPFVIYSTIGVARQASAAKKAAQVSCVSRKNIGPGLADFLEVYGSRPDPLNAGRPFFAPKVLSDYRKSLGAPCPDS